MNDTAQAFLNELRNHFAIGDDIRLEIEKIASRATALLALAAGGIDITASLLHLRAQFMDLMSIQAYRSHQEAKEAFTKAVGVASEIAQRAIYSAVSALMERI